VKSGKGNHVTNSPERSLGARVHFDRRRRRLADVRRFQARTVRRRVIASFVRAALPDIFSSRCFVS
jgi:hypothetical protein